VGQERAQGTPTPVTHGDTMWASATEKGGKGGGGVVVVAAAVVRGLTRRGWCGVWELLVVDFPRFSTGIILFRLFVVVVVVWRDKSVVGGGAILAWGGIPCRRRERQRMERGAASEAPPKRLDTWEGRGREGSRAFMALASPALLPMVQTSNPGPPQKSSTT